MANTVKVSNTTRLNKEKNLENKIEAVNFDALPNMSEYTNVTPHVEKTKTWLYILICSLMGLAIGVAFYFIMIYAN